MNLQYPKLIMRNDSIGIETLPTLALFLHTSSFTFCNYLTHAQCLPTVFRMFQLFRCFRCFATLKYPNQVRSMANLQFAVLCGSRVKGFGFRFLFRPHSKTKCENSVEKDLR